MSYEIWLETTRRSEESIIASWCEAQAENYPASVFTPDGETRDAIAGTAIREFLLGAVRRLREDS